MGKEEFNHVDAVDSKTYLTTKNTKHTKMPLPLCGTAMLERRQENN